MGSTRRPLTCPGRTFEYHTHMNLTTCGRADLQELDGENPATLCTVDSTSTLPLRFARGEAQSDINGNEVTAGTVRSRSSPYGEYRVTPSADLTDKGFTGRAQNDEVALNYMRAPYYVPGIGRFASADTIVPDPLSPQTANRYSYAQGNPTLLVDPTGHIAWIPICAAIGAIATTAIYFATTPADQVNTGDALTVVATGAIGGALIGTGIGDCCRRGACYSSCERRHCSKQCSTRSCYPYRCRCRYRFFIGGLHGHD